MSRRTRIPRPFQRGRLRLRVLVAAVSVTLVALGAFDFAAVTALRGYLTGQVDTELRATALDAQPSLIDLPNGPLSTRQALTKAGWDVENDVGTWVSTHRFLVDQYSVLYVPDNTSLQNGLAGVDQPLPGQPMSLPIVPVGDLAGLITSGQTQTTISVDGFPLRSVAVPTSHGALVVSTSLDNVNNTVNRLRLIVLIGSAAALLFIGLGLFWLLRRGFRPIETMAAQADRITAGDLTDRVSAQDPRSEVGRLGSALNGMLARIEASMQEQENRQELMRRLFADTSHELRTPLASLRANAELYQQGALPERQQVDEVMRRITLEARRMGGLVEDMLRLARLDQLPDQHCELVNLTELVEGCVDRMQVAAPEHRWHSEITAGLVVVGDEELLRRAVDNLLANVRSHTPDGTSATVALHDRGDVVEIEVNDTGPGVPDDRRPRIFDRFYRADPGAQHPGSGLGLAIVTEIITVHNGTVVAEPNPPHGLRVRLTLPVAGPFALTQYSHNSPAAV